MKLSTRTHGAIDLILGVVALVVPWVLGIGATPAGLALTVVGLAVLITSLVTNFEIGRVRRVEIPVHLWIDAILGFLLAFSPWLLTFDRTAWVPHVVLGVLLIVIALFTETVPGFDRRGSAPPATE